MASVWEELKRRNVVRVAIAYAIVAWLLIEVSATTFPILNLPDWAVTLVTVLLLIGLPVALIFAWAFELTPEGLKHEKEIDRSQSITRVTGRKLDFAIIGVLAITLAFFALDRFVWNVHDKESVAITSDLEKSIAVLPFDNRSADESDAYFVDGIHDDILTQLHKLSGIDRVISRTSVERYRDTDIPVPEIAAELGVATILEGGVQRAGENVRITVQLIDAANDKHLWAENFDRELTATNVFEIQSEISTAIATSLSAVLTDEEASDLADLPTESLAAWERYQLGKYAMRDDRSPEALLQARSYFEDAIRIDQNFALAYVGLADAITLGAVYEAYPEATTWAAYWELMAESQAAANRALDISPRLGEAYTSLGYSHFQSDTTEDWLQADTYYRKAIELAPNYEILYRWYAQTLWLYPINQPDEALSMAEHGVALDPFNSINQTVLAWAFELNGRINDARKSYNRAFEVSPTNVLAVRERIKFFRRHSEFSRAISAGIDALGTFEDHPEILYEIANSYYRLGDKDKFEYWSSQVLRTNDYLFSLLIGAMTVVDGGNIGSAIQQYDEALAWAPGYWQLVHSIAYAHARNNQPEALLDFVETHAFEMLDRKIPEVRPQAAMLVAPVAWALGETGEVAHADKLFELGLEVVRNGTRHADHGYGVEIADVEIHVVKGDHQFALEALTQAVEDGYRSPEWPDRSPFLDPIRGEPEFIAAMDVIRADLAAQLAGLNEMERRGELPTFPQ